MLIRTKNFKRVLILYIYIFLSFYTPKIECGVSFYNRIVLIINVIYWNCSCLRWMDYVAKMDPFDDFESYIDWKILPLLSERITPFSMMRASFKSLDAIVPWCSMGSRVALNWAPYHGERGGVFRTMTGLFAHGKFAQICHPKVRVAQVRFFNFFSCFLGE